MRLDALTSLYCRGRSSCVGRRGARDEVRFERDGRRYSGPAVGDEVWIRLEVNRRQAVKMFADAILVLNDISHPARIAATVDQNLAAELNRILAHHFNDGVIRPRARVDIHSV